MLVDELYDGDPYENNENVGDTLYENNGTENNNDEASSNDNMILEEGGGDSSEGGENMPSDDRAIVENGDNNTPSDDHTIVEEGGDNTPSDDRTIVGEGADAGDGNTEQGSSNHDFPSLTPDESASTTVAALENTFTPANIEMLGNSPSVITEDLPETVTAAVGETVSIEFIVSREGLKYIWYFKGPKDADYRLSSVKTNPYTTTMTENMDGREMYCVVTDANGEQLTTSKTTLHVPFKITEDLPKTQTVAAGETIELGFTVVGRGLKYQWFFQGPNDENPRLSSVKTNPYTTTMTEGMAGRKMYCVITDVYGDTLTTEETTLRLPGAFEIAEDLPETVTAAAGQPVEISFTAVGNGLTYAWYFKVPNDETPRLSTVKTNPYTTTMTENMDGREMYCVITDANGDTLTTDTTTLHVPFEITEQPPAELSVAAGDTVEIGFTAVGRGLKYQWYFQGPNDEKARPSSVKTNPYTTTMEEKMDGRVMYCEITDANGVTLTTKETTLHLDETPDIIDNNILYAMNETGGLTVVGYAEPSTATQLTIPETVAVAGQNMRVTEIGEAAFMDNKNLESVFLPDSIVTIRACAFKGCANLTSMGSSMIYQ